MKDAASAPNAPMDADNPASSLDPQVGLTSARDARTANALSTTAACALAIAAAAFVVSLLAGEFSPTHGILGYGWLSVILIVTLMLARQGRATVAALTLVGGCAVSLFAVGQASGVLEPFAVAAGAGLVVLAGFALGGTGALLTSAGLLLVFLVGPALGPTGHEADAARMGPTGRVIWLSGAFLATGLVTFLGLRRYSMEFLYLYQKARTARASLKEIRNEKSDEADRLGSLARNLVGAHDTQEAAAHVIKTLSAILNPDLIVLLERARPDLKVAGVYGATVPVGEALEPTQALRALYRLDAEKRVKGEVLTELIDAIGASDTTVESFVVPFRAARRKAGMLIVGVAREEVLDDRARALIREVADMIGAFSARGAYHSSIVESQKLEVAAVLAGGVAHDFTNLLNTVAGNSELILESLEADDDRAELLRDVLRAAQYGELLTRQLLGYSRAASEESDGPLDVVHVLGEMESLVERLVGQKAHITTEIQAEHAFVAVGRGNIEQVVLNLLLNARDAVGGRTDGAITLRLWHESLEEAYRDLPLDAGHYLALEVKDNGVGMDEQTRLQLFRPFFTTKPEGTGTGLGLTTVMRIVREARGHVEVESTPGRGSRFVVRLPLVERAPVPEDVTEYSIIIPPQEDPILVVEDNRLVRTVTMRVLKAEGFKVVEAASSNEALMMIKSKRKLSLVLSDIVMPGQSGYELASSIKRLRPHLPVLLMTGYADAIAAKGSAEDYVGVIHKPFRVGELEGWVRDALRGARRAVGASSAPLPVIEADPYA